MSTSEPKSLVTTSAVAASGLDWRALTSARLRFAPTVADGETLAWAVYHGDALLCRARLEPVEAGHYALGLSANELADDVALEVAETLAEFAFDVAGANLLSSDHAPLVNAGFLPGPNGLRQSANDFRAHRTRAGCHSYTSIVSRQLPTLTVAAAALVNTSGQVLVAQRPAGKAMAGLWEFPGGKLEPGETPEAALIRELAEELGVGVAHSCLAPIAFASHSYPRFHLLMPLFAIRQWDGEPVGQEGQALQWCAPRALWSLDMPPADRPIIPLLCDLL